VAGSRRDQGGRPTAAGVSAVTVSKGVAELEAGEEPLGRTRRKGGRPQIGERDRSGSADHRCCHWSTPTSRGRSGNRRCGGRTKSVRHPRRGDVGCRTCGFAGPTVAKTAQGRRGSALQANAKTIEGRPAPGPRRPSSAISTTGCASTRTGGDPVISVDTKKKELVGKFKKRWAGMAAEGRARAHQRARLPWLRTLGKAIPYGVYGRRRRLRMGVGGHRPRHRRVRRGDHPNLVAHNRIRYPTRRRGGLLICADGGGSNGLPHPIMEDRARPTSPTRPGSPSPSAHLPPRNIQMEQDRAPAVSRTSR